MKIEYRRIKLDPSILKTIGYEGWILSCIDDGMMYFYRPLIQTGTNSCTPTIDTPDDNKTKVNQWIKQNPEEWNSIKYDCSLTMKQEDIESMAYPAKLESLAKKAVYLII